VSGFVKPRFVGEALLALVVRTTSISHGTEPWTASGGTIEVRRRRHAEVLELLTHPLGGSAGRTETT
jgi:hypothetical protein